VGEIEEDIQALVLAIPAPRAVPLVRESSELTAALRAVRYRSRWVLPLGSERPVPLPAYREFQGGPIERVAELLLEDFRAHAGRRVTPDYLGAQQWRHAFVETPAATPWRTERLWDDKVQMGVCGDRVDTSQVDRVHSSGIDMARVVAEGLGHRTGLHSFSLTERDPGLPLEARL
jgi:predicted NAD/FAD-dependent oxidoreductase